MGVAVVALTVLDVKVSIELVVLHVIDGITVVLEVITISLVLIVASKDGTREPLVVVNLIDGIILVLVVNIASTVEAVSDEIYSVE